MAEIMLSIMLSINLPMLPARMKEGTIAPVTEVLVAQAQIIQELEAALQATRADFALFEQLAQRWPQIEIWLTSQLPPPLSGTRLELAQRALEKEGRPLYTRALVEAIRRHGGPAIKPAAIRSAINKHLYDYGDQSPFVRLQEATYGLRAWGTAEAEG